MKNERASMLAAHMGLAANDGDFDRTIVQMQVMRNNYAKDDNWAAANNCEDAILCVKALWVAAELAALPPSSGEPAP